MHARRVGVEQAELDVEDLPGGDIHGLVGQRVANRRQPVFDIDWWKPSKIVHAESSPGRILVYPLLPALGYAHPKHVVPTEQCVHSGLESLRINTGHITAVGIELVVEVRRHPAELLAFDPADPEGVLHHGKIERSSRVRRGSTGRGSLPGRRTMRLFDELPPFVNGLPVREVGEADR